MNELALQSILGNVCRFCYLTKGQLAKGNATQSIARRLRSAAGIACVKKQLAAADSVCLVDSPTSKVVRAQMHVLESGSTAFAK